MGVRIVSLLTNTDENHRRDPTKVYFYFYDDDTKTDYKGTMTWEQLFELLVDYEFIKADGDSA